jgi:hypothetical protein
LSSFALTILAVVALSGDTLQSYIRYGLVGTAAIKGGSLQLFAAPLALVFDCLIFIGNLAFDIAIITVMALSFTIYKMINEDQGLFARAVYVAGLVLILAFVIYLGLYSPGFFVTALSPALMLLVFALGVWAALIAVGVVREQSGRAIYFLVPFSELVSSSMSSGGHHIGVYGPVGLFMLLLPLGAPRVFSAKWATAPVLAVYVILGVSEAAAKVEQPVSWQHYLAPPMFTARTWINHPLYGYMYINTDNKIFFSRVCATVKAVDDDSMLSTPYSFANYYCGLPPWHDYVQTFFDTASRQTIEQLIKDLGVHPPTWVLYERQLRILRLHEKFYNHGRRLAHRDLDEFIMSRINAGAWKVTLQTDMHPDDRWMLIRTGK